MDRWKNQRKVRLDRYRDPKDAAPSFVVVLQDSVSYDMVWCDTDLEECDTITYRRTIKKALLRGKRDPTGELTVKEPKGSG
jgi:hypothetical protein